ncbi:MAG: hypothetical protein KIT22_16100, partial [Verrucomicrobiae bacterium]|nr:hypothetical protein [Verrucomicrobiae bacterium]
MNIKSFLSIGALSVAWISIAGAQTVIETFEYPSSDDLAAAWTGSGGAAVSITDDVAPASEGTTAMKVDFSFPSVEWATEVVSGVELAAPVSIDGSQYVSFRIKGDPAFASADFRNLYLYAYDTSGNFGRWGAAVPTTADWQIFNFQASTIEQPWDSTALPDFSQIIRFSFFQYGSQAAIAEYSASIVVDDLTVRDTPLADAQGVEQLVEAFEYADDDALLAAWIPTTGTIASLTNDVSPRASGTKALRLDFTFASQEWSTDTVSGPTLETPVTIGPSQYLVFRIKGDPAFAAADFRNIYLYAYDTDGNFGRWGAAVP